MNPSHTYWKNHSVIALASNKDPIAVMKQKARECVFAAMEKGWAGPPFSPFELAALVGIRVVPREDINDARTILAPDGRFVIEYNPSRPASRSRYSICHEIAHTFFPDCGEKIRNRQKRASIIGDEWQLEMLCNIGAAELLMPMCIFNQEAKIPSIDQVLLWRKKFGASVEAVLLRAVHISNEPCAVFSASAQNEDAASRRYLLEYVIPSSKGALSLVAGTLLPKDSCINSCTAIGFTQKAVESWTTNGPALRVEAVGIPGYPGRLLPRVVGMVRSANTADIRQNQIIYLKGDATSPVGQGPKVIAHVINDKTPNWGGNGFATFLARKWPMAQYDFRQWAQATGGLHLGSSHSTKVDENTYIFHMIAQHGYGESARPRLRYDSLETSLRSLAVFARQHNASVHMPRIGAGQARGSWPLIAELILESLCATDISVAVYDLPNREAVLPAQMRLTEGMA
jgi:Zn-dependent peptidase ImmA (M78 family)/O-acetyl-ADP-ribose deacetylase (regulator of RNase III)